MSLSARVAIAAPFVVALVWLFTVLPAMAEVGGASWYQCCNPVTACGVKFRPDTMGAAHRTRRCGSKVTVTDLKTGRSVVVTIVDRGPFVRGRVIDLYRGAARSLGILHRGTARVRIN